MNRVYTMILTAVFAGLFFISCATQKNDRGSISPAWFPQPEPGYQKIVLTFSPSKQDIRVELIAGQVQPVDCNHHILSGAFDTRVLDGYGIPYYVFKTDGRVMSTLMACPDEALHEQFVTAPSMTIPLAEHIIVYMPAKYELRYRLWSAGAIIKLNQ